MRNKVMNDKGDWKNLTFSILLMALMILAIGVFFSHTPLTGCVDAEGGGNSDVGDIYQDFTFSIDGDMAILESYTGTSANVTVPEYYLGYNVEAISSKAFAGNTSVESIDVPSTVVTFYDGAFSGCTNLKHFSRGIMGAMIVVYGDNLFQGCTSLTNIDLGDECYSYGDGLFKGCTSLKEVNLPKAMSSGKAIFEGCPELEKVTIRYSSSDNAYRNLFLNFVSESVEVAMVNTKIPEGSFEGMDFLTGFEMVGGLYEVEVCTNAFKDCVNLKYFKISSRVFSIGNSAFEGCTSLEHVTPSDATGPSYKYLGDRAFYGCTSLNYIVLPKAISEIGDRAFMYCTKMIFAEIHSPKVIGEAAFEGCKKLATVEMGEGIESYGECTFLGCSSLMEVSIFATTSEIPAKMFLDCTGLKTVEFWPITAPEQPGIKKINESAFAGCTSLEVLYIPDTVTEICNSAFVQCVSIKDLSFLGTLSSIGDLAFYGCTGLSKLIFSKGHEITVGEGAFRQCSNISEILLTGSVTLKNGAFSSCMGLKTVTFDGIPNVVADQNDPIFDGCDHLEKVVLECNYLSHYMIAGATNIRHIVFGESMMNVENKALSYMGNLRTVEVNVLSEKTLSILRDTLEMCELVERVIIGSGTIPSDIFNGSHSLKHIELLEGVTSIEPRSFAGCINLETVYLSSTVQDFDPNVFDGCTSIQGYEVSSRNPVFKSIDGALYRITDSSLFKYPSAKPGECAIADDFISIGELAFVDCQVSSIYMHGNVLWTPGSLFETCPLLEFIGVSKANPYMLSMDGILYNHEGTKIEFVPPCLKGSIRIPDGIEEIPAETFKDYTGLESVTFGSGLILVNRSAFSGCTGLTEVLFTSSASVFLATNAFKGIPFTTEFLSDIHGWDFEIYSDPDMTQHFTTDALSNGDAIRLYFKLVPRLFTITWENWNGTVLLVQEVPYNTVPVYNGYPPMRDTTAHYSYKFNGWDPKVVPVTGDTTYTATYYEIPHVYFAVWNNWDGTNLYIDINVPYGTVPEYRGPEPTRPSTASHHYTFCGWTPTPGIIDVNTVYTAVYTETLRQYTVIWQNWDSTILQTDVLDYGSLPSYRGDVPVKEVPGHEYAFVGWTPEVSNVTGNVIYTAKFVEVGNKYTITFVDHDGTELAVIQVEHGVKPVYPGDTPTRESTAKYTYTFNGWSPELAEATGPATYIATYTATINKYAITFVNWDGTALQESKVAYGELPKYNGDTPTREGDPSKTYVFAGWDPKVVSVTGDATYMATFVEIGNEYTITFVNWNGTVLQESKVAYGELPKYNGNTPTREATAEFTYEFSGWSPEIAAVTAPVTYVATYTKMVNSYVITFVNWNGDVLQSEVLPYGTAPVYTGETPTREATAQYTYMFSGWDSNLTIVKADKTYTAEFSSKLNWYHLTFRDDDGSVLLSMDMAYGMLPSYGRDDPVKDPSVQYTYEFAGWSPAIRAVTGDAVYTATYVATLREYTVTFNNYDGTQLQSSTLRYGAMPTYTGDTPTREATAQYEYTFDGWSPELSKVTGDIVYTAAFSKELRQYTVSFVNYDGSVLQSTVMDYGSFPSYDGDTPAKASTEECVYIFAGWDPEMVVVTADAIYEATYTSVPRQYSVVFLLGDDVYREMVLNYGDRIIVPFEDPVRPDSNDYKFVFAGWLGFKEGMTVVGYVEFVAHFIPEPKSYPQIVDKEVAFEVQGEEMLLGEAMIDETHHRFETGEIDKAVIRLDNGSIAFDKDAFFLFRSESVTMTMERIEDSSVPFQIMSITKGCPLFDISVGDHHNFGSGTLTLSIDFVIPDNIVKGSLRVLHFGYDGSYDAVDFVYENGNVTFETNSLSYFAVVYDTIPDGNTSDNSIISIVIVVMFVVGAIGLVFSRRF